MLMIARPKRQSGLGLVELMIGILVGLIVVAAALSLLSTTMASSNDNIKMMRLDQEMRQVMTMLTRDLRRATMWDPAADVVRVSVSDRLVLSSNTGTITITSVDVNGALGNTGNLDRIGTKAVGGTLIFRESTSVAHRGSITAYDSGSKSYTVTLSAAWPASVTTEGVPASSWSILRPVSTVETDAVAGTPGNCLLIVYDTDASGTYTNYSAGPPETPNEFFGYRYDSTDKAVETRTSSSATCAGAGTGWENLTDERTVEITEFSVTVTSPGTLTSSGFSIDIRDFTIAITGQLKADSNVTRTIQETVRVRNDELS